MALSCPQIEAACHKEDEQLCGFLAPIWLFEVLRRTWSRELVVVYEDYDPQCQSLIMWR